MDINIGVGVRRDSEEEHAAAPDYGQLAWEGVRVGLTASFVSTSVDLRPFSPPTRHDQGPSQTCVANGVTRAAEIKQIQRLTAEAQHEGFSEEEALGRARAAYVKLSRRDVYFKSRDLMPTRPDGRRETQVDDGTHISLAAEALRRWGVCPEEPLPGRPVTECWPWATDLQSLCTSPSWMAMRSSYVHKISKWAKIKSSGNARVEDVISNLHVGNPIPFATTVSKKVWSNYDGSYPIDVSSGDGAHCVVIVGWLPQLFGGVFVIENSYGPYWGDFGFGYITPDVIAGDASFDFLAMMGGWETWRST
jgi:hypothetical protein